MPFLCFSRVSCDQNIYRVFLKIGQVNETKQKTKEQQGINLEEKRKNVPICQVKTKKHGTDAWVKSKHDMYLIRGSV